MEDFELPTFVDNPDMWGPCGEIKEFQGMPYQPFSKSDRLGKISDWHGNLYQDRRGQKQFISAYNEYAYVHEDDENTFQLVDNVKVVKPIYYRKRMKQVKMRQERERQQRQQQAAVPLNKKLKNWERDRQRQLRKWQKQYGRNIYDKGNRPNRPPREGSVRIKDDWEVKETMEFVRLQKLSYIPTVPVEDLVKCGRMLFYDKFYDRVNTKHERNLVQIEKTFHRVTTHDDPVVRELAKQNKGNVFAADFLLANLMCCCRSVYPWDIIVNKLNNGILFFDFREDSNIDLFSVSENATETPNDEPGSINSPGSLAEEATYINHNFTQQVLRQNDEGYSYKRENPFLEEGSDPKDLASVGYKYRRIDLGNNIKLIVRCSNTAVTHGTNGELQFINIHALNEWDFRYCGGINWRATLDNQRGAVLATEIKNNSCKLAKWTVCATLSDADQIRFGYVSRANLAETTKHVILGVQQFQPTEFAAQISLNMANGWGILRCIIDTLNSYDAGKYMIIKDPNKPVIRIYKVPEDAFDKTDSEEESDEEESSEDEDDTDEGDETDEEEEDLRRHDYGKDLDREMMQQQGTRSLQEERVEVMNGEATIEKAKTGESIDEAAN